MYQELISKLHALSMYYQTAHWQCKNSVYYADHLLFDRLYDEASERIDQVAEKAIGITGNVAIVNLPEILKKTYNEIKSLTYAASENVKFFEDALQMEEALLMFCTSQEEGKSVGVRNMLGDIADESESRVYLLKQRLAQKSTPIPPITPVI